MCKSSWLIIAASGGLSAKVRRRKQGPQEITALSDEVNLNTEKQPDLSLNGTGVMGGRGRGENHWKQRKRRKRKREIREREENNRQRERERERERDRERERETETARERERDRQRETEIDKMLVGRKNKEERTVMMMERVCALV